MIHFFASNSNSVIAVGVNIELTTDQKDILKWLFSDAKEIKDATVKGAFIGPRKEMISPWSTNAVEITQNCGIEGIERIEEFISNDSEVVFDPMLQEKYNVLDQDLFTLTRKPQPILPIKDIEDFNSREGLALSDDEVDFLKKVSEEIQRPLTDAEIFGFSQINSEHCRHKIFNGEFIIDGEKQELSLFQWIKKTSKDNPNFIVSAYKDNVAFISGPVTEQFAPVRQDAPDYFKTEDFESVISLKAETHNFPTTVEPFNGAATGSGGEIRDRLAGGKGSFPLAGTAVYMTSYPRTKDNRLHEQKVGARSWLYHDPAEILVKASNGASDFGNKFGQPLIGGSLLTFEHEESEQCFGFDKVIMLAGGIGFAKLKDAKKDHVKGENSVVVLGGDNYRIGMGGGAVSSVNTGEFQNSIELNAIQRSNPEMQKRVANAIRAMAELPENPITSIHDHGAGGHLNCLSELVEESGGEFDLTRFPIGDPTLSDKEILSNESQERMGLVISNEQMQYLKDVSSRERAPIYEVGKTNSDQHLSFKHDGDKSFDLKLHHLFGSTPKTILEDRREKITFQEPDLQNQQLKSWIEQVLRLEAVASKDWLTNKVDRSVTGKVATQQTVGEIQLPLNNVAVMALDFKSRKGIGTSIGHAPVAAMIDPGIGSKLAVTESLTNLVFAPLTHGLKGVSLSANWMWPAKNKGENARLYEAVKELSVFCSELGINVPTGKDSLSMTQKYPDGKKVIAPGTVIISSVGEVYDIRSTILPAIHSRHTDSELIYIDFSGGDFQLGGSSFFQSLGYVGEKVSDVSPGQVIKAFGSVQRLIRKGVVLAGHDVSAGGLITTLLEMNFPNVDGGLNVDLSGLGGDQLSVLFSEKPAVVLQVKKHLYQSILEEEDINFQVIGGIIPERKLVLEDGENQIELDIDQMRRTWMESSYLLDKKQTKPSLAEERYQRFDSQPLSYDFPKEFDGSFGSLNLDLNRKHDSGIKAAIIREKGVNGDREMAYALWMAGFDVKDVHMTDLVSGRENLEDVNMIVFVGGFSNSDVLGSAKGWAGSFLFNPKAKETLDQFYRREDTLSLGVCNGCQVMMELETVYPGRKNHPKMKHNSSGKFESAFINVDIQPNDTVLFGNMEGNRLGIWLAHGEGRFELPESESSYNIPVKYSYKEFPGNPNGSDYGVAALASENGRHVAIMPHLERTIFPWNWAHYINKQGHEVSPWIIPFVNARKWVESL